MRYLSSLNRNRILRRNTFAYLVAVLVLLSLHGAISVENGYLEQGRIEVTDGTEYRYLYTDSQLTGSRVNQILEEYSQLDLPTDKSSVKVEDWPIVSMIEQVFGWKFDQIEPLSDDQFYQDRSNIIRKMEREGDAAPSEKLKTSEPIQLGYAEGWRNINEGMGDNVWITLAILSFLLLPIFNEDKRLGTDDLIRSTEYGNDRLNSVRLINAFQLSSLIYILVVIVFIIPIAAIYGLQGGSLPIQGDPQYFLSAMKITNIGQFFINLIIGYVAVAEATTVVLIISVMITEVITGYAIILFLAALSYFTTLFDAVGFKHYFWNFFSTQMAYFSRYYNGYEFYFGIPAIIFVPAASMLLTVGGILLLRKLLRKREN